MKRTSSQNAHWAIWVGIILVIVVVLAVLVSGLLSKGGSDLAPTQTLPETAIEKTSIPATNTPAASTTPSPTSTPAPTLTPSPTSTGTPVAETSPNELVLSRAIMKSDAKTYCSWQILGYDPGLVYAWVFCLMQVEPFSGVSVPAAITTDANGHYLQVALPGDGTQYAPDIRKLFPADIATQILNNNVDISKLQWGIDQRKAGNMVTPYVIPNFSGIKDCTSVMQTQTNLPLATDPGLDGWKTFTQVDDGFALDVPPGWEAVESQMVCPDGRYEPHYLLLYTPDSAFQIVLSFRLPYQDVYITRTGTPAGEFVNGGTVNFLGVDLSIDRLVYQNKDKSLDTSVMYAGGSEFLADGILFTIGLDVTSNPKSQHPGGRAGSSCKNPAIGPAYFGSKHNPQLQPRCLCPWAPALLRGRLS